MTKALLETSSRIGSDFARLQQLLQDRWLTVDEFDGEERHILVVPSLSLDQEELQKIEGVHYYEERLLCSLIRLRNPNTHLVYVTSHPVHPSIVDYYLELLPGIPSSHARSRLKLFSDLRRLQKTPDPKAAGTAPPAGQNSSGHERRKGLHDLLQHHPSGTGTVPGA